MPSIVPIKHWKLPEILFVTAACFAMGAIGFFIAVYIQLHSAGANTGTATTYANSAQVPVDDKVRQLSALSQSAPEPGNSTSGTVNPNQADTKDGYAAEKLKLLQQMNSK